MLLIESSWTTFWPATNWELMDNILTCTSVGIHLSTDRFFQTSFLNCIFKLLFRDTIVTHHLGFLKNTKQHKQQKLTRVRGEVSKATQLSGPQKQSERIFPVISVFWLPRWLALVLSGWGGSFSLLLMQLCAFQRTVLLPLLPAFETDTGTARAGAWDHNRQAGSSQDWQRNRACRLFLQIYSSLQPMQETCVNDTQLR